MPGSDGMTQCGVVQLFDIVDGQLDVSHPSLTLHGDKELSRFGHNVVVSSLSFCRIIDLVTAALNLQDQKMTDHCPGPAFSSHAIWSVIFQVVLLTGPGFSVVPS